MEGRCRGCLMQSLREVHVGCLLDMALELAQLRRNRLDMELGSQLGSLDQILVVGHRC